MNFRSRPFLNQSNLNIMNLNVHFFRALFLGIILLAVSCNNSPKNSEMIAEETPSEMPASSDEEGAPKQAAEEEKTMETEQPEQVAEEEEPNTYMDPFDPDFITGKWQAEDFNEVSFETWFYVEDGFVSGQYCAVNADASRIDCGTQDEVDMCYVKSPYLVGAKLLELEIVSCYSQKKGKATIEPYGDGQIRWRLTEPPGEFGVDHFAAADAILYKITFDPWDE